MPWRASPGSRPARTGRQPGDDHVLRRLCCRRSQRRARQAAFQQQRDGLVTLLRGMQAHGAVAVPQPQRSRLTDGLAVQPFHLQHQVLAARVPRRCHPRAMPARLVRLACPQRPELAQLRHDLRQPRHPAPQLGRAISASRLGEVSGDRQASHAPSLPRAAGRPAHLPATGTGPARSAAMATSAAVTEPSGMSCQPPLMALATPAPRSGCTLRQYSATLALVSAVTSGALACPAMGDLGRSAAAGSSRRYRAGLSAGSIRRARPATVRAPRASSGQHRSWTLTLHSVTR